MSSIPEFHLALTSHFVHYLCVFIPHSKTSNQYQFTIHKLSVLSHSFVFQIPISFVLVVSFYYLSPTSSFVHFVDISFILSRLIHLFRISSTIFASRSSHWYCRIHLSFDFLYHPFQLFCS